MMDIPQGKVINSLHKRVTGILDKGENASPEETLALPGLLAELRWFVTHCDTVTIGGRPVWSTPSNLEDATNPAMSEADRTQAAHDKSDGRAKAPHQQACPFLAAIQTSTVQLQGTQSDADRFFECPLGATSFQEGSISEADTDNILGRESKEQQ
jgi:hypothetical protein